MTITNNSGIHKTTYQHSSYLLFGKRKLQSIFKFRVNNSSQFEISDTLFYAPPSIKRRTLNRRNYYVKIAIFAFSLRASLAAKATLKHTQRQ